MSAHDWMNLTAFLIGLAFGAIGQVTGFRLMSGLRGWWRDGDGRGIRAFAWAAAIAVAGTAVLTAAGWVAVLLVAAAPAGFALSHAPFRAAPRALVGGLLIGLLIPAGWFTAGTIGADEFDPAPVTSLSFVAPMADTVLGLMLSTGGVAQGIGIPVVAGVPVGAFAAAALTGRLKLEGFQAPRTMLRYMAGGVLMGIGGVLALGCSIGQGLTGLSTLALGSFAAVAAVLAGAFAGLRGPLRIG